MSETTSLPPHFEVGTPTMSLPILDEAWLPADLCSEAVAFARRVQALPSGREYGIMLVKGKNGKWRWSIKEDLKREQP